MGIFGIDLFDPTQTQTAQLQPFAAGVSPPGSTGGMFGQPAPTGGMSPWLRLALQTVAGGLAGSSGKNFGQGVAIGAQYGQQAQETARRNKYVDEQTQYLRGKTEAERRAEMQAADLQKRRDAYIATLPAGDQQMAALDPNAYISAQVAQRFPKPQQPTSDIQNWQFYKQQGGTLPFNDWMLQSKKAGAASTTVTVGSNNGGVQMPYPLEKSVIGDQQRQEFNESDQLARLQNIQASFDPKWLTLGPRAGQAISSLQEFVGIPLSPDAQQSLTKYTQFRQNTVEGFNLALKAQTGTAVSPGEAVRIAAQLPVAGTGIFDGDAPTPFKAKMDNGIRNLKLALMRRHFALKQGMDPLQTGIDLADVPKLIERRGAELEAGLKQQMPGITPEQLKMEVATRLRNEFGTGQ